MTKHTLWDMIFDSRRSSISGWFLIPKTNSWRYNYKSSFLPSVMTVVMRILIEFDRVHELECACVWVVDGWIIMNLLNLIRLCELICLDNVFVWLIDTVISLWGWIKYYFILSYTCIIYQFQEKHVLKILLWFLEWTCLWQLLRVCIVQQCISLVQAYNAQLCYNEKEKKYIYMSGFLYGNIIMSVILSSELIH